MAGSRTRTHPETDAEGDAGVGSSPGSAPAHFQDEEKWWLRNRDRIYAAEQRAWNPPKFREPRQWSPRRRPPLEARNSGGFLDVDGSWCDSRELMEPELNYGRRKRILSPSATGSSWGPVGYDVEADFVESGGWTIAEVREKKRAERRERLRQWLQVVKPTWDSRGSTQKEWNRALKRYQRDTCRLRVVFFYEQLLSERWAASQLREAGAGVTQDIVAFSDFLLRTPTEGKNYRFC